MTMARNVAANYLGRAYSIASLYLFTPLYIKYLGLPAYGVIGFYTILLTIGALVDVGLTATLSREAARLSDRRELLNLSTTIERLLLSSTLLVALAICLLAPLVVDHWLDGAGVLGTDQLVSSIQLMAFTIPVQLGVTLYVGGLSGLQLQGKANAIQALYVTLRGGLIIPVIAQVPSLELFFAWQLGAGITMLIVARAAYVRAMGFSSFTLGTPSLAILRPTLGFAGGMFGLTVISALTMQIDKLVVSGLFTVEQFAVYTLTWALSQLPYAAVAPMMLAMLPRLTELSAAGRHVEASAIYDRFVVLVALVGGFGSFSLALFAPEILTIWLQLDALPPNAVELVRVLSMGWLLFTLAALPFHLGLAYGHSRTSIIAGLVSAVAALPVLIFASQRLGLVGAAIPWVLTNLTALLALNWNVHRRFYHGSSHPAWVALAVSMIGAVVTIAARATAWSVEAGPLATCLIAASVSGAAIGVLAYLRRKDIAAWRAS